MKIVKIEWRNIFSYGNKIETLEFGNEGKLWQLSGRSGSGKSSLLTIPKLLLYGKTEGSDGKPVKLGNIANRINKNGWIRGTIKKGKYHNSEIPIIKITEIKEVEQPDMPYVMPPSDTYIPTSGLL